MSDEAMIVGYKEHACGWPIGPSDHYCAGCGVQLVLEILPEGACKRCGLPIEHHLRIAREPDEQCSVRLP